MQSSALSRRSFVAGALATAGAVGVSGELMARADEAASTERPWEVRPEPIADDQIVATYEADIVVVGAGIAGVCAAQSAAEEGGSVIVLEKTSQANGRGLDIGSIGNRFQRENPDIAQYIDAAEADRIAYEFAHSLTNRALFRHWARNSGEAFDHLADYLSENYGIEPSMSFTANPAVFEASDYYREMPTCQSFGEGWFDADGNWLMAGVVSKVVTWAEDLGATFMYDTPAKQLVQAEDGSVTGVIAQSADGFVKVNATKAVILATGDISGNPEMLKAWCPLGARVTENVYTPVGANSGDGICMGLWAGASMQVGYPAPMIHPMGSGGPFGQSGDALGFLCVNRDGERYTVEFNNTPGMANSRFVQPGAIGYSLFDANYADYALKVKPSNLSIDGSPIISDGIQERIDAAVAAGDGLCFRGDSIAELAEQMGIPADALESTVNRWNELCAAGVDEDMSLDPIYLNPLDTPPFYASFNPQATLVVIYGLNCDSHSRVCDADDNPIPGLYAIGNTQGNFFAVDYPLVCPGLSHGRCVTFGYTLPKAILRGELI